MDVESYLLEYQKPTREGYAKVSSKTLRSNKNGIVFYYKNVLKKKFDPIILPRASRIKIKDILEIDELKKMIKEEKKERNKLMLKVLYGTGLRVAELCNLKKKDIKLKKNCGSVFHGKGNKDRRFYFESNLSNDIKSFINNQS